ncbi:hypothetical protein WJU17_00625 [Iodidimonas sp. SYSU 1G8]
MADRFPMMVDGSAPVTRLSATEVLPGWANTTASPRAMLKLCQLITAFWLDCCTVTVPGPPTMVAAPAATLPPDGKAKAEEPSSMTSEPARPAHPTSAVER